MCAVQNGFFESNRQLCNRTLRNVGRANLVVVFFCGLQIVKRVEEYNVKDLLTVEEPD